MKCQPLSVVQRKRKALAVVQFFFFSALGCLFPFLSSHMKEIGLTTFESAFLNCLTAVAALIAAPISGVVAHKLDKYQTLLVITLLGSGVSFTSLLFVPRVIRTPRHPHIVFDCTNSQLRMESCVNWDGNCSLKPKTPALGNYTNFALTKCKYVCNTGLTYNASWYPLQVCFSSGSEGSNCLLHDPTQAEQGSSGAWTQLQPSVSQTGTPAPMYQEPMKYEIIQFDSRFDRWPVVSLTGENTCVYQSLAPLILNHKSYDAIHCKPFVQNCVVHCKVNVIHRPKGHAKPPAPCYDVIGNPSVTFYAYLVVRSFADLFIFVAYNLLDGLAITLTNNFDVLYGGWNKMITTVIPLIVYPILTGYLVDYYSLQASQPDYAPPFILFDGLILITAVLVIAAPASPLLSSSRSRSVRQKRHSEASQISLRSTASLKALHQRSQIPVRNWYIFALLLVPITLWSGIIQSLLQIHLYPFYIDLGVNKLWLGLSFAIMFVMFLPFGLMGKQLVSGIGRLHLILTGFLFYSLRLASISLLSNPKWLLIPVESMEAFSLPIMWMGITSYSHFLIKTTLRLELMNRVGLDPSTSNHMRMQYFLNGIHFGLARVIGCGLWMLWLTHWHTGSTFSRNLMWLATQDPDYPETDEHGFRILLRLCAIISISLAVVILFFIHIFGHIIDCFTGVFYETKQTVVCIRNGCFKCFSLLCCCSCSCKMGTCQLCRRRNTSVRKVMIQEDGNEEVEPESEDVETNAGRNEPPHYQMNGVTYARLMESSTSSNETSVKKPEAREDVVNDKRDSPIKRNGSVSVSEYTPLKHFRTDEPDGEETITKQTGLNGILKTKSTKKETPSESGNNGRNFRRKFKQSTGSAVR